MTARDSAHDFIVKYSPSVCITVVASMTAERVLLTMLMEQQTVTNPAAIRGLCAMTKHQCMLAQACLPMINHLTSSSEGGAPEEVQHGHMCYAL